MPKKAQPKYNMRIDLNVLNHLGLNLYSNVPAVLSEVVANSWDADADVVRVTIDENSETIIIEDNGHGMSLKAMNDKYLTIGYPRREKGEIKSPKHKRDVMGRKGIGKLSLFSIAEIIEVYSYDGKSKNAFLMDAEKIRTQISSDSSVIYNPQDLPTTSIKSIKGTRIVLKKLKKRLHHSEDALIKRLARRFGIIGPKYNFKVIVNKHEITVEDRDYFHKIEYLWYYGNESKEYEALATNAIQSERRANTITVDKKKYKITGWIGLAKDSGTLQDEDDNLNKLVLLVRGKMAKDDLLEGMRHGGLFTKYLFGEIRADFLDIDELQDIATSSRQDIFEEDNRYVALVEFLKTELLHIQNKRANFKREEAEKEATLIPSISEWYGTLTGDTKARAKRLFGKINEIAVDAGHKKQLFSHGVLAFESLRYKDALDALEQVSLDNLDEFLRLFHEFDEIEASMYYKITKERTEIIRRLKEQVHDENALEKVLQEYLFRYLWLLDPSWDRATENAYKEEQVKSEFDKIDAKLTKEERKGRVDIRYKKPSGKHVIIELKRASIVTSAPELQSQVDKYIRALRKFLKTTGETYPIIEAICIVGKPLKGWEDTQNEEEDRKSMQAKNTRVITYQQLINDAYDAYKDYLDKNLEKGTLLKLIQRIESEVLEV